MASLIVCIGCRAIVPDLPGMYGPAHSYLGASPGCWQLYSKITAKKVPNMTVRGLMADTYMVQHPGVSSRQSIQSVARHLLGLYCALELKLPFAQAIKVMKKAPVAQFSWLDPPASLGSITVIDMVRAFDEEVLPGPVEDWAATTWQAWGIHHPVIRRWADLALA
jgi:hypothetical protein